MSEELFSEAQLEQIREVHKATINAHVASIIKSPVLWTTVLSMVVGIFWIGTAIGELNGKVRSLELGVQTITVELGQRRPWMEAADKNMTKNAADIEFLKITFARLETKIDKLLENRK